MCVEIAEFSVWLGRKTTHRRRLLKLIAKASQTIGEVFYRGAKRLFYSTFSVTLTSIFSNSSRAIFDSLSDLIETR